jgi:putative inorganic carbon (hco3(-)) transporter
MAFTVYLVFLILTYLRPIEAFAPELESYRPMVWLSLLALMSGLFSISLERNSTQTSAIEVKNKALQLLVMFCAAIFASLAAKAYIGGAFTAFMSFSPSAVLFFLTLVNVNSLQRLKVTCFAIAACTLILAIASIVSYHTGFMVEELVLRQSSEAPVAPEADALESEIPALDKSGKYLWRARSMGFLTDPNDFGQAIVMALPFLIGGYVASKKSRSLIIVGTGLAISMYTIYLTHSRGALLGVGALLFFGIKRRLGTVKTAMLLGLLAAASTAASGLAGGREFSTDEESAGGRIDAWSEGLKMLLSHPIFGIGHGNFLDYHTHTAHNTFVLCFSELGLAGYFIFIGMLVFTFKNLNRAIEFLPDGSEEKKWAALHRTSLVGFLTCAFFLSRTYIANLYILLALCICASQCTPRQLLAEIQPQLPPIKWVKTSAFLSIASIVAIYIIVILKNADIL